MVAESSKKAMNTRLLRRTGPENWLLMPRLIVALPLVILVKGAGNWSLDRKATL